MECEQAATESRNERLKENKQAEKNTGQVISLGLRLLGEIMLR